jgi:hypothetical protein
MAQHLLLYRLFDISNRIYSQTFGPVPIHKRRPFALGNSKFFVSTCFYTHRAFYSNISKYDKMQRWPDLVRDAIQTLQSDALTSVNFPPVPINPEHQFEINAISHLWTSINSAHADMIRSNVMVAAMFIKYLMSGQLDLPNSVDEFYAAVCGDASQVPQLWQKLRLPLQMALAISPLCLLLPAHLANKDIGRTTLMAAWKRLGNQRPASLRVAEDILWKYLFGLASEQAEPSSLPHALENIRQSIGVVTDDDSLWLKHGKPSCFYY